MTPDDRDPMPLDRLEPAGGPDRLEPARPASDLLRPGAIVPADPVVIVCDDCAAMIPAQLIHAHELWHRRTQTR